ncbi:hypothetical protein J8F10_29680 [Gemmata sp. G18]|uniref:Uncharacterized protein n=1 Tax=Gemmata palustris TaxID=2822762 RepID=A0ABS5C1V4_9BACT|nr:hypothetical protein [Gemmata palustris]MBP3959435.1 hypothetical protein [Gemmata palustris]
MPDQSPRSFTAPGVSFSFAYNVPVTPVISTDPGTQDTTTGTLCPEVVQLLRMSGVRIRPHLVVDERPRKPR